MIEASTPLLTAAHQHDYWNLSEPELHLLLSIRQARQAVTDDTDGRLAAKDALDRVFDLVKKSLPEDLQAWSGSKLTRSHMIEGLRFLRDTGIASALLTAILSGLEELDRGMVVAAFRPARGGARGGKTSLEDLRLKAAVVQASDELRKINRKQVAWEEALRATGFSRRTVQTYRKQVETAGNDLLSPLLHYICFGELAPEEVLKIARRRLSA